MERRPSSRLVNGLCWLTILTVPPIIIHTVSQALKQPAIELQQMTDYNGFYKHIVQDGETLDEISIKYGPENHSYRAVSRHITALNQQVGLLPDPDMIYPGQEVLIPHYTSTPDANINPAEIGSFMKKEDYNRMVEDYNAESRQ